MDQYISQETAYRLLAGRLLATAFGSRPASGGELVPEMGANSNNNINNSGTIAAPPQPQLKFIGSPADYSAPVFTSSAGSSNNNTSYSSSGGNCSSNNALLLLNNSHDSSTSIGNSPASGTDHSGSFSAGTPGSVTGMLNSSGNQNHQRSVSNSGLMFSSSTPPVGDVSSLGHGSVSGPPRRSGKQGNGAQCPECDKRFNNSSALAKHKLIHSQERRYSCPKCGKGFKRQDHLSGHMMTHEEQKPYKCYVEGCDKSYCDSRSLRRHLENHHGVHIESPFICPPEYPPSAVAYNNTTATTTTNNNSVKTGGAASTTNKTDQQFFTYEDDRIRQLAELNNSQTATLTRMPPDCINRQQHFSPITPAPLSPNSRRLPLQTANGERSAMPPNAITIVQCAICSKKFRSLASLNGHMRIHGPRRATVSSVGVVKEEAVAETNRPPSPVNQARNIMIDGLLEKQPLPSTSSCVFTPSPMPLSAQPVPPPQSIINRPPNDVFIGAQQSQNFRSNVNQAALDCQMSHNMRQQNNQPQMAHQQPTQHCAPLDLAFNGGAGNSIPNTQGGEDYRHRLSAPMPSYGQSAAPSNNPAVNPAANNNSTASLALAMMKAALPSSFSVDRLNSAGVDPRSAWLSTLYSTDPSAFMAQMYQQQQGGQPGSTSMAPPVPATSVPSFQQCQKPAPTFTVPQSPGSYLRSRFAQPMPPNNNFATSWTPFPNTVRQPPPLMKDIGTSPFVTIPKDRQVFFPPDSDDQTSGCLSTQPQCSPSTPGTISVVGDHPPLSAGPLSAGYISVVGTPPQQSPAVMFGTPGSSSHSGGASSSSGNNDTMPQCRMMPSTTPCPPSPIAINTNNKANIQPPPQSMGLLMPAPSPHNKMNRQMLPPVELPPPPPCFNNYKRKFITVHENDENNHQNGEEPSPSSRPTQQSQPNSQNQKEDCDHLCDLDSSPELFDQPDFDPHIYLRSPPQTAPPVLFAAGSEIDVKKLRHFSFDDCDVEAVRNRDHERDLVTPSPPPDEEIAARQLQPLPSPAAVFKSPPPFVLRKPNETTPPQHREPQQPVLVTNTEPIAAPVKMEVTQQPTLPPPPPPPTSSGPTLSTSSVSSESSVGGGGAKRRPRPPPLPIIDSNYGPVSQLRAHIDAAIGSANSSLSSAASTSSSSLGTATTTIAKSYLLPPPLEPVSSSNKPMSVSLSSANSLAASMAAFIPPYTPPPILSPFRMTPGTFWAMKQADSANLGSSTASSVFFNSSLNDGPPVSDRRPRINVGNQFQSEIPPYRKPSLAMRDADRGELIFNPNCLANISEDHISALCELARSSAAGSPHGSNIELVMHLLSATNGSIEKVTLLLLNAGKTSELPPAIAAYRYQENAVWTAEEIRLFMSVVGQLKKDFWQISRVMRTKSVKECIEFYYLWKRLFSELTAPTGEPPAKRQCLNPVNEAASSSSRNGRVSSQPEPCHSRQNLHFCDFCPKVFDKKRAKSFHMKLYHPAAATSQAASSTTSVAASLLASSGKLAPTSTSCQLVFAAASPSINNSNVHTAQVAQ